MRRAPQTAEHLGVGESVAGWCRTATPCEFGRADIAGFTDSHCASVTSCASSAR